MYYFGYTSKHLSMLTLTRARFVLIECSKISVKIKSASFATLREILPNYRFRAVAKGLLKAIFTGKLFWSVLQSWWILYEGTFAWKNMILPGFLINTLVCAWFYPDISESYSIKSYRCIFQVVIGIESLIWTPKLAFSSTTRHVFWHFIWEMGRKILR